MFVCFAKHDFDNNACIYQINVSNAKLIKGVCSFCLDFDYLKLPAEPDSATK